MVRRTIVLIPSSEGCHVSSGVGCSPAHQQRKAAGKRTHSFVRCRRAAGTALTAAVMTLMSIGGFTLISDHTHLVYQRNTLKAATDAASLAVTRHWQQALGHLTDDDDIKAALRPLAERYILANIPKNRREKAQTTLQTTLTLHHGPGMVDVDASADLSGGVIFTGWMLDANTAEDLKIMRVETRTERVEVGGGTIEVVLAVDNTGSMGDLLSGEDSGSACRKTLEKAGMPCPEGQYDWKECYERAEAAGIPCEASRLTIVKQASKNLVRILRAAGGTVAVGIVPWNVQVRLNDDTRQRWEDHGWATYQTRRYYPNPDRNSWTRVPLARRDADFLSFGYRAWYPDPHIEIRDQNNSLVGEWVDLPTKPEPWKGCLVPRRTTPNSNTETPPAFSTALPWQESFSMAFYQPMDSYHRYVPTTYRCRAKPQVCQGNGGCADNHLCYDNPDGLSKIDGIDLRPAQSCNSPAPITPLTIDLDTIEDGIDAMGDGNATYSTAGIAWAHRLLAPDWRPYWGANATHPVDKADDVQKAIVLLTDGEDNMVSAPSRKAKHRTYACDAAKKAGIKIFTIAAMNPQYVSRREGQSLRNCSSEADDPDGTYVFINNTSPDLLKGAFQEIGRQLVRFRRVY